MNKGVEFYSNKHEDLSSEQAEILDMITKDFLTAKQISLRRSTSLAAVYKTMTKLRSKGYLSKGLKGGLKKRDPLDRIQPPTKKLQKGIRLHAQEFNCKILWRSPSYENLLKTKNLIYHDQNTIRLFPKAIEVYCAKTRSFLGADEQRATAIGIQYWSKFFNSIEQKLGIILIKGINTRIRQVNAHYADINNDLAADCNKKKIKVNIYGTDDGKLWFNIDNSWQLNEAETVHPRKSEEDMTTVKRFFNDIRDNNPPTMTELLQLTSGVVKSQQIYAENIKTHIKAIKDLGDGVQKLTSILGRMEKK